MKKIFNIEVDCANCANKMENATNKVDGVKSATVNFMAQKISVEFEDGANSVAVMQDVLKECRKIEKDCKIYF